MANSLEYPERIQRGLEWTQFLKRLFIYLYSDHSSLFLRIALPEGEEEDHQEETQRERDQQVEIQYEEGEV